jgi:hypothetical protein
MPDPEWSSGHEDAEQARRTFLVGHHYGVKMVTNL